ncbi:hypothetical protein ACFVJ5_22015 [Nocardia sp. NPDC127606]|uniref:hypothetical protein n=1 Tax=Nocardia sp. NPDC127606 TaxID=3345406 RepID=UPI00363B880C
MQFVAADYPNLEGRVTGQRESEALRQLRSRGIGLVSHGRSLPRVVGMRAGENIPLRATTSVVLKQKHQESCD